MGLFPNGSALLVASSSSRRGCSLASRTMGTRHINGMCSPITGVLLHRRRENRRPPVQQNTGYPTAPLLSPGGS